MSPAEDPDEVVVDAEVLEDAKQDVRQGYGPSRDDRPEEEKAGSVPFGSGPKLYRVTVSQTLKVRADNPAQAQQLAEVITGAEVLDVEELDQAAERRAAFRTGAGEGAPRRGGDGPW